MADAQMHFTAGRTNRDPKWEAEKTATERQNAADALKRLAAALRKGGK